MNLDKPFFSPSLTGTIIRIPIGIYFFLSGRLLLQDPAGLVEAIRYFDIVNDHLAQLYGLSLPYLEIIVGIMLALGFLTSLAAIGGILLLGSFIYAFGIYPDQILPFNKDIVWLASCLALLCSGPGAFSIDSFRNKGS